MTITYPDHSGNQHSMTFNDNAEALAHLRLLESADKKEKEVAPTASGRITLDRWHKMRYFRKALGLNESKYSDE